MSENTAGLSVEVTQTPDGPVISAAGDLDLSTADHLEAAVTPFIKDPVNASAGTLTVDLAKIDFCDSAGINALVKLRQLGHEAGWTLTVVNPQPHVRHVLELSGLTKFLAVPPE